MSDNPYPPYGGQPYGQPYGQQPYLPPQEHPQATTVLVLGILGLVLCQILSPFAWVMGNRVVAEIDAGQGRVGGRGSANAGRICGIVGTVLLGLSVLVFLLFIVIAIGSSA